MTNAGPSPRVLDQMSGESESTSPSRLTRGFGCCLMSGGATSGEGAGGGGGGGGGAGCAEAICFPMNALRTGSSRFDLKSSIFLPSLYMYSEGYPGTPFFSHRSEFPVVRIDRCKVTKVLASLKYAVHGR